MEENLEKTVSVEVGDKVMLIGDPIGGIEEDKLGMGTVVLTPPGFSEPYAFVEWSNGSKTGLYVFHLRKVKGGS